ncbi:MAG: hypothetical protein OXN17_08190 [Candidatus Poribacteria bacterium]|nr:hypothetical protein [Candidatus Poribacteria bacterium]MDE0505330.1 hypothetical protein [Candidatus Poribacteria bacterium]
MASIRRYKDGRVAIIGNYSNGSPFVRRMWVRGENPNLSTELDVVNGDVPFPKLERFRRFAKNRYKGVDD